MLRALRLFVIDMGSGKTKCWIWDLIGYTGAPLDDSLAIYTLFGRTNSNILHPQSNKFAFRKPSSEQMSCARLNPVLERLLSSF